MSGNEEKSTRPAGGPLVSGSPTLRRWTSASIAVHACVLAALLYVRSPQLAPVERPGDASGHLLSLTYAPGMSAPAATLQSEKAPPRKRVPAPSVPAPTPAQPEVAAAPTAATSSPNASSGVDALGDGDTTVALVVAHPSPKPDLSQLPSGTSGDVIVDVVIDKDGRIAKYTMMRGLGHGVDQTVLATIQQWTFQPATRNGVPVASEQELLFHYVRG
ncbi:energy transducer TonB [Granulicella sp. L46]|jgi:protein TonB|uniref:energy transducer TonB n=1 Tax=Granulicella sp. L46 TaxID=1641865 RepID=UPI00131DCF21|nr:energy transducer TonB [Granulicella sp. L46]